MERSTLVKFEPVIKPRSHVHSFSPTKTRSNEEGGGDEDMAARLVPPNEKPKGGKPEGGKPEGGEVEEEKGGKLPSYLVYDNADQMIASIIEQVALEGGEEEEGGEEMEIEMKTFKSSVPSPPPRPSDSDGDGLVSMVKDLEPEDLEPEDLEPKNLEPEDLEPEDLEPKNLEPEDLEPEDLEPKVVVITEDSQSLSLSSIPESLAEEEDGEFEGGEFEGKELDSGAPFSAQDVQADIEDARRLIRRKQRQDWRERRRIRKQNLTDRLNSNVSDTDRHRSSYFHSLAGKTRWIDTRRRERNWGKRSLERETTGGEDSGDGDGEGAGETTRREGETIRGVSVIGYDMHRKLYSIKLELDAPSTSPLVYIMSWEKEIRDTFTHVRKHTSDTSYCSLLLAIEREFNFRPWFQNFHEFRKGVPGRSNHRSPQHVEGVFRFLFLHAGTPESAHYDCANLFVISLFRLFERGHIHLSSHFQQWQQQRTR